MQTLAEVEMRDVESEMDRRPTLHWPRVERMRALNRMEAAIPAPVEMNDAPALAMLRAHGRQKSEPPPLPPVQPKVTAVSYLSGVVEMDGNRTRNDLAVNIYELAALRRLMIVTLFVCMLLLGACAMLVIK